MGLSLNEMAQKSNMSSIYYSELEKGIKAKPSDAILKKIADACGIKLDTLKFFLEDNQGKSLDYERCLLESLERLAEAKRAARIGTKMIAGENSGKINRKGIKKVESVENEEENETIMSCYPSR